MEDPQEDVPVTEVVHRAVDDAWSAPRAVSTGCRTSGGTSWGGRAWIGPTHAVVGREQAGARVVGGRGVAVAFAVVHRGGAGFAQKS